MSLTCKGKIIKPLIPTFVILMVLFLITGCQTFGIGVQGPGTPPPKTTYEKKGPPPHAPAHGYRHKHPDGHDLEYHEDMGAYVVLNIPETYFGNNLYIRLSTDGEWMVSATLEGGWRIAAGNEVPEKLKEYKYKEHKDKKHKDKKSKKDKKKKNKYDDEDEDY